ncbi:hypothetical protein CYMTET_54335 [Cymbomonas tetramitiformis]|uniref:Uncharacterized protein n=1 Tax=Cymbomonas tetramitiformis TaxID=36881 RepID=A0AAE0BFA4_9CHLO|nr:hypothetical protein CYMTET_54335 [Cymbomonas tetramitiformis]
MEKCLKEVSRDSELYAGKSRQDSIRTFVAQNVERLKSRCGLIKDTLRRRRAKEHASRIRSSSAARGITVQDVERVNAFQLARKFGPRAGMSVSERYRRALKFDLHPPEGILEIVRRWPEKLDVIDNGTMSFGDVTEAARNQYQTGEAPAGLEV